MAKGLLGLLLALAMLVSPVAGRAQIEAGRGVSVEGAAPAPPMAQPQPVATPPQAAAPRPPDAPQGLGWLSNREAALTVMLLVFALVYLYVAVFIFSRIKEKNIEPAVRFASMLVIVIAALVLMFVGYDSQQVAPAYGLLGTLAGYILGRSNQDRRETRDADPRP